MSMTKEEAIEALQKFVNGYEKNICGEAVRQNGFVQAIKVVISALRPVTREQVEGMRGEWVAKHRHRGGFRRVTGVDDMGELRTITIDERCEYDDRYCSRCGKQSPDNFLNFCGYCGAPMTDEAVEMAMERLEVLLDVGN